MQNKIITFDTKVSTKYMNNFSSQKIDYRYNPIQIKQQKKNVTTTGSNMKKHFLTKSHSNTSFNKTIGNYHSTVHRLAKNYNQASFLNISNGISFNNISLNNFRNTAVGQVDSFQNKMPASENWKKKFTKNEKFFVQKDVNSLITADLNFTNRSKNNEKLVSKVVKMNNNFRIQKGIDFLNRETIQGNLSFGQISEEGCRNNRAKSTNNLNYATEGNTISINYNQNQAIFNNNVQIDPVSNSNELLKINADNVALKEQRNIENEELLQQNNIVIIEKNPLLTEAQAKDSKTSHNQNNELPLPLIEKKNINQNFVNKLGSNNNASLKRNATLKSAGKINNFDQFEMKPQKKESGRPETSAKTIRGNFFAKNIGNLTQNNFYPKEFQNNDFKINAKKKETSQKKIENNGAATTRPSTKSSAYQINPEDFALFDKFITYDKETGKKRDIDWYIIGKTLGKGSYATVKLALSKLSGKKVAIKTYEKSKLYDEIRRKNVRREIEILFRAKHLHVIKLLEVINAEKQLHLVLEYVGTDSLYTYMKKKPEQHFDEKDAKKIFQQIIHAVAYCHANYIIHRDLKLENILMDSEGNVKLIDFGFSISAELDQRLTLYCGTPSYFAPEIVAKKDYCGGPTDTWACGVLLYKMLSGKYPFHGADDKTLYNEITKCNLSFPSHFSEPVKDLLSKILIFEPQARLTAFEASKHRWLTEN